MALVKEYEAMMKREEIREGMKEILQIQCGIASPLSDSVVDLILSRQSYQDVVIKVDRELPFYCRGCQITPQWFQAGYVAVEPLIEVTG